MPEDDEEPDTLTARDSAGRNEVFVYLNQRDAAGKRRCIAATGKRPRSITTCAEHLVAHGVCVDCTQAAGRIRWAI